jgi:uncharacterized membrane protein YesL
MLLLNSAYKHNHYCNNITFDYYLTICVVLVSNILHVVQFNSANYTVLHIFTHCHIFLLFLHVLYVYVLSFSYQMDATVLGATGVNAAVTGDAIERGVASGVAC